MTNNPELMREILHGKQRRLYGLHPPIPVIDHEKMVEIIERIATLPEYNSLELIHELATAGLITFDEMYILLGIAVRQPEQLLIRYRRYADTRLRSVTAINHNGAIT